MSQGDGPPPQDQNRQRTRKQMDDQSIEKLEWQLAALKSTGAPATLRQAVLGDVDRELRSARWDRRLLRVASLLLVVGVALNGALVIRPKGDRNPSFDHVVRRDQSDPIVETAVIVAEATNAKTGGQFARHLAALSGRTLTSDDLAAIDAALENKRPSPTDPSDVIETRTL